MSEIESCELTLSIKELKLAVKFPCKLTFQHAGKTITSEIASSAATNLFTVNKEITIREDKPRDTVEININLATDKGGNIMAGIIRLNLKDMNSSQGQVLTLPLQKCLDSYASCTLHIRSVRINKSRVKTINVPEDKRSRMQMDKFETKSEAPVFDLVKSRARANQSDQYLDKKVRFGNNVSSPNNFMKEKALSTVGFKVGKDVSFDRQELGSRFKHLNKKAEEDSKTVITGRWRDTDQVLKSTMEANEKALKMEILKYKTKYEESQRNVQEKQKQIKGLKDQVSQLNRQLTEKQYLLEEISSKGSQIAKLQDINKQLSKEFHQDRNKIIDLEREIEEQKGQFLTQISRLKQDYEKKQYDLQKQIYEKRQQLKELSEEGQYKVNQIKKMKVLIEDLERGLEVKALEFQKIYAQQKNEHAKTRTSLQAKITQTSSKIQWLEGQNNTLKESLKATEDHLAKANNRIRQLQESLRASEQNLEAEISKRNQVMQQKKTIQKAEEQISSKLKQTLKQIAAKQKETSETTNQLNESNNSNKKKITQLADKNKALTARIQQLQSKCNILSASQEKLKRSLDIAQKQSKNLQQSDKISMKNLKLKDERILQLERELTDLENKIVLKESLGRKDVEYKVAQAEKLIAKIAQLEKQYDKEREQNQSKRLELLKNENKIRMLQETIHRHTDQLSELKANFTRKEEQNRTTISELNEEIKGLESREAQSSKALHNAEMERINFKNQIAKAQKSIENLLQKQDRYRKREGQLQSTIKSLSSELDASHQELVELESSYKALDTDYRMLQADKSKHEKITTIISEQKDNIKSDVSKLKKEIERRDQKEEQYLSEIKTLKEQATKVELRLSNITKQSQKFKNGISETVKSVLMLKQNFLTIDAVSHQGNLDFSRSIQRSRIIKNNQSSDVVVGFEESKLAQAIENFSRDTHQTISFLNEQLRKVRKEKDAFEKENSALSTKLKDTQDELARAEKEMSSQIDNLVARANEDAEQYEERISYLQKELSRKEKALGEMTSSMQEITAVHQNQRSGHQINVSDLLAKIQSLRFKIVDLQRKDESNAHVFVSLQEKIVELEQYNSQLSNHNEILSEQLLKKERAIALRTQQNEQLSEQFQIMKKQRSDLSMEVLSLKESLAVQLENSQRLFNEIKSEQSKNAQLKLFQNDILREKEALIKKDFEKSEKLYSVEEKLQDTMMELAERTEEVSGKVKTIGQLKDNLKQLQIEANNTQLLLNQAKINLEKERERLKEKERKIVQKDAEIQGMSAQIKKNNQKYQAQLKKSVQENELLSQTINKTKLQYTIKVQQYDIQIKALRESERRNNDTNTSLQQQIYFQRQNNALSLSKIDELKHHITELQHQISRLLGEVGMLNDQVREKEESLFALSGKLYASDNRLQGREEEFKGRLEKAELEWRYKIEEICEEYEHKLQILQREKNYVRNGMNDFNQNVEKLQAEKIALKLQHEREKEAWDMRAKRFQEEKLNALIEKNKQIEKLREVIEELQEKIKRKDFEAKLLDDEKKKLQEKQKQLRAELQRADQKKNESLRALQKEIDQLKRKEGQLKRFKEALRNSQWTTQRQIKKSIQNVSKTMANLTSESGKSQVLQLMRSLQSTIVKLALPNVDEL